MSWIHKMWFNASVSFEQNVFHEDVVVLLVKQLQQEEARPEEQRPTAQAKAFYIKVKLTIQIFIQTNFNDPISRNLSSLL